ncbi:cinnamoyl- reductase [Trichoderma arundinaceum]|uniref:Cinnamoyl-reductase n=1 Tax=Trichoderma arundinaceum TaxID=490622 RepID=A0A395NB23_TRIAR|nr:cinnamoyl- reductase [Trichoderma arundinaceum]
MAQTVLITGASGYIATHVVQTFLRKGYNVRGTYAEQLSVAIVPDIAAPNAFDEAVKGVDGIIHTASPFSLTSVDYEKELLQPAINGTTSVLEAAQRYNPTVSRIVITSSFASILDPTQGQRPGYVYKEADWDPITVEQANSNPVMAYIASKTFAEKAAFDYVKENKPNFSVTTLCPPMVYGPILHSVSDVKAMNTSSGDIYRLIDGSEKNVPDTLIWAFADVRDLAEAHLQAYEKPEAAGQRYLIATSSFSYQQICDIIRDKFPELRELTPKGNTGDPLPPVYKLDNSKASAELGIKFRSLEETVVDMVNSFLKLRK